MSNIASVIQQLKDLAAVKQEMGSALTEYDNIKAQHDEEASAFIKKKAEELYNLKCEQGGELDQLSPSVDRLATKSIPVYDEGKINTTVAIIGLVFYAALVLVILSTAGIKFLQSTGLAFIVVFALFISAFIWFFKGTSIRRFFAWEKEMNEWEKDVEKSKKSKKDLMKAFVDFENTFRLNVKNYYAAKEVATKEIEIEKAKIAMPDQDKMAVLSDIIDKKTTIIENNTILHQDHIPYIETIIKILETGRADDLKEAINLAIDEEMKIEMERERRAEAHRQEAILEEQAYQTRLHNREMERIEQKKAEEARQHAAKMEAEARKQAEETKKLREEIEKQNRANNIR